MHGMQKVRGSNPLSSTQFSDLCSVVKTLIKTLTGLSLFVALVYVVFVIVEDAVYDGRSPARVPSLSTQLEDHRHRAFPQLRGMRLP